MDETEIPRPQWRSFCEGFTRQHHGWLVGIRQIPTRELPTGRTPAWANPLFSGERPLQEVREGSSGDAVELMVTVGKGLDETSFLIENALVLFSRAIGGAHAGLRVDSGNGMTTLIEFRSAAEPASLDGLSEMER